VWTAHDSAASSNTEIVKMTCQKRKKGNEEGERKEERGRRRETARERLRCQLEKYFLLGDVGKIDTELPFLWPLGVSRLSSFW